MREQPSSPSLSCFYRPRAATLRLVAASQTDQSHQINLLPLGSPRGVPSPRSLFIYYILARRTATTGSPTRFLNTVESPYTLYTRRGRGAPCVIVIPPSVRTAIEFKFFYSHLTRIRTYPISLLYLIYICTDFAGAY